ncbi:hypothetical protein GWK47_000948 [Chionoecetes opilio]|uniref:Uncharacterized protein n=1 Tax=Chionoecetes opilio TaxID=41210 RepID=A0A8J4Y5S4_CHIOP|nr:hypothetical protein GWK47_000948 [Chionoecetes opilio]
MKQKGTVLPEKQNDGEHSPNSTGLLQHTKRAVYQAGIWATRHQAQQQTPTAEGCGWTLDAETKSWVPVWSSQPAAAKAVSELVKCACKSAAGCGGGCSCKKASWKWDRTVQLQM